MLISVYTKSKGKYIPFPLFIKEKKRRRQVLCKATLVLGSKKDELLSLSPNQMFQSVTSLDISCDDVRAQVNDLRDF